MKVCFLFTTNAWLCVAHSHTSRQDAREEIGKQFALREEQREETKKKEMEANNDGERRKNNKNQIKNEK